MGVTYNPQEHIALSEIYNLTNLKQEQLESLVTNYGNGVQIYQDNGVSYIGRLDLGRIVHYATNGKKAQEKPGIAYERRFTDGKTDPFASIGEYIKKPVEIRDTDGKIIFQKEVETPKSWNTTSITVAANKYFFKPKDESWVKKIPSGSESSPQQLFGRVSRFFAHWGQNLGYFKTEAEKQAFEDDLNFLQINQMAAFNSPVYFNAGLYDMYGIPGTRGIRFARDPETGTVARVEEGCYTRPQTHACFISGPADDLESLLDEIKKEGSIFSDGSGIGHDLSNIRARGEHISSGGKASGPMSFFRVYDVMGGVIESGGKTRRAARMTTMRYHHPDVLEFIRAKVREDHKALTLIKQGYSAGFEGEAYQSAAFQNTNLSVRVDDHFFDQVEKDGNVQLRYVKDGKVVKEVSARHMLQEIAFGSWRIGDPAVQYESKIQEMNTAKNSGMINSSNPCSEYMFLDETSCNLNSINLLKFADTKGNFDVEGFRHAVRTMMIAADIANDAASYPTETIAKISPEFRTTGVGYANLGALLMRRGIPYDSNEGRALAAAITAVMHAETYKTSAELAAGLEPFIHFELNREPMLEVVQKHRDAVEAIGNWPEIYGENFNHALVSGLEELITTARTTFDEALILGKQHGYRNAQTTVIAPTGTIALLMGCDTTGIEPAAALVTTKSLSGGGTLELVVEEVSNALTNLGYTKTEVDGILDYLKVNKTVEGAPHLNLGHYPVFDTAFSPIATGRTIDFKGHVKMLGAAQPFVSGAISKTNNLPHHAPVRDIYDGYMLGYKLGLKAISVFRQDSKPASVLSFGSEQQIRELKWGEKKELPTHRSAFETEVKINETPLHVVVAEYPDGTPGQVVFLSYKAGSTLGALLDTHGISASKSLKRGNPLEQVIESWKGHKFEPHGLVSGDPWIKTALSPLDYAAKFLELHYLGNTEIAENKDGLDKTKLRGYTSGAFETYERRKVDDWSFDEVIHNPRLGGFSNNVRAAVEIPKNKTEPTMDDDYHGWGISGAENSKGNTESLKSSNNVRGVVCEDCGNIMRQTAPNCYECDNCFNKLGGCGL